MAGPNGAGKSTLIGEVGQPGVFVNADVTAHDIDPQHPENASLEAGRRVIALLKSLMDSGTSFTYETTLSSHQSLNVMRDARSAGFAVVLLFVVLRSAKLHVARVASRVAQGGHSIPDHIVLRRYDLSLRNLQQAIPIAERVAIYDNSFPIGARLMLAIENSNVTVNNLDLTRHFDRRISDLTIAALRLKS